MTTVSEAAFRQGPPRREFSRRLMAPERAAARPILAFYRFARAADDVADHPTLPPETKLELLDDLDDALTGRGPPCREAEPLRLALAERGLSPKHALDLLEAFRLDARKIRYAELGRADGLLPLSAAPVGRFVLDVHGEDPAIWPASDALCAALQVINHLQDCAKDYRRLDRVYLPLDTLAAHGASVEMLDAPKAPPALARRHRRACPPHERTRGARRGARPADQGHAARRGDRRDPGAGAAPRARSRKPRSAERARPSRQGRLRAGRRARRRALSCLSA